MGCAEHARTRAEADKSTNLASQLTVEQKQCIVKKEAIMAPKKGNKNEFEQLFYLVESSPAKDAWKEVVESM